jgi:hypothetical protein
MISRRSLLRMTAGAVAGALIGTTARTVVSTVAAAPAPGATKKRPRYLVILHLGGGPDSILTLDPKNPSDVVSWVDNPVAKGNVQSGGVPLGAHFAPLATWSSKMAVVHGVRSESVNHPSAVWQLIRMRRRVNQNVPGILDIIARHRDGQPLGAITGGNMMDRGFTSQWLPIGTPQVPATPSAEQGFAPFEAMDPGELAELAQVMRQHAKDPSLRPADRESYQQLGAYLERIPTLKKFASEEWKVPDLFSVTASSLQRLLWCLEGDLVPGAFVSCTRSNWDTHTFNLVRQERISAGFVVLLQTFLEQLHTRRNQYGTLAENTTVVIAGELGRVPRLNSSQGKDHAPTISMLFMGAGIATGSRGNVIGQTDKEMRGLPLDPASGRLTGARHTVLDDVGTTLLHLFGIEPTQYGYAGRVIEPLLA